MSDLSIVSYNVRGLCDTMKRKEVFQFLRDKNADLYFLQEIHSTPKLENLWRNERGGTIFFFAWGK